MGLGGCKLSIFDLQAVADHDLSGTWGRFVLRAPLTQHHQKYTIKCVILFKFLRYEQLKQLLLSRTHQSRDYVLWNAVSVPLPRWMKLIKYTALICWYFQISMILSWLLIAVENFNKRRWILSNFIFMYICNNCKRILIQKVYLKSCYVKSCKRLHLANYDITISPLPIRNTG